MLHTSGCQVSWRNVSFKHPSLLFRLWINNVLDTTIYLKIIKHFCTDTCSHWSLTKSTCKMVLSYEKLSLQTFNAFCLIHFSITDCKTAHWPFTLELSQCIRTMVYYHLIFCSLCSTLQSCFFICNFPANLSVFSNRRKNKWQKFMPIKVNNTDVNNCLLFCLVCFRPNHPPYYLDCVFVYFRGANRSSISIKFKLKYLAQKCSVRFVGWKSQRA